MVRRGLWIGLVALAVVGATLASAGVRADDGRMTWVAVLSGSGEVPARDTQARGQAFFQLSDDGMSIRYRLIAANIENVIMAHIHLAAEGMNGGIVVWLYPAGGPPAAAPDGGRFDGVLVTGSFDASKLVGALAGHPLSDLIDAMNTGGAYVNVHTDDGVAPTNTGAGDFPGGEIRGQITVAS